jgi:hypothetical protein
MLGAVTGLSDNGSRTTTRRAFALADPVSTSMPTGPVTPGDAFAAIGAALGEVGALADGVGVDVGVTIGVPPPGFPPESPSPLGTAV